MKVNKNALIDGSGNPLREDVLFSFKVADWYSPIGNDPGEPLEPFAYGTIRNSMIAYPHSEHPILSPQPQLHAPHYEKFSWERPYNELDGVRAAGLVYFKGRYYLMGGHNGLKVLKQVFSISDDYHMGGTDEKSWKRETDLPVARYILTHAFQVQFQHLHFKHSFNKHISTYSFDIHISSTVSTNTFQHTVSTFTFQAHFIKKKVR